MKKSVSVFFLLLSLSSIAQSYQPTWESLDKRPTPVWWKDAKFGIFIHWGVYAVPGYSTKGNYAEWYQNGLQNRDSARNKYHREKFDNRTYYDLAKDFRAELFQPDEWAKVFEASGAKYIVLTSKHHDGFALWPSREASKTWGFPWNAVEAGPHRDLLGDLFKAVRKTSVHAGMYFSLYEWFNPLWLNDKPAYVQNHMWPQMKDLINNYQPDVFWTDGEWDANAETWKSQEFLSWLFNESPVKDKIVVNDRWGSGVRFKHAGFFTPEYQPDLDFENHDWEESRGMGYSYGYNREEDAWDYNSTQSLVIALIDKVSRGGNFLLDIGPDEHGKIPPIMQERLLQIGDWMKLNGEAIYNTRRWKTPSQWSSGRRDYKPGNEHVAGDWKTGGDIMLKLTVDPEPGYAVKEIFYTYNPQKNNLYALFPKYPENNKLVLKNIQLQAGTKISLLADQSNVTWTQDGNDVTVQLPSFKSAFLKAPYSYAVRIENYGRFASKPQVNINYDVSPLQPTVTITGAEGTTIHYTIDGSEPTTTSNTYSAPFTLKKDAVINARAFADGALNSDMVTINANLYQWKKATTAKNLSPGLLYQAFELDPKTVSDLERSTPVKYGVTNAIDLSGLTRKEKAGLILEGYIKIEKDGVYNFYLSSDDGSRLMIDGEVLIDHDGLHGADEKQGTVALKKGYHSVKLDFIQATGGIALRLSYSAAGIEKKAVPSSMLFHGPPKVLQPNK